MELRGRRCRAERRDEVTAPRVVVEPVQHSALELTLPDHDTVDSERQRLFVERARIHPRAAVDVERKRVAISCEMVEALELAGPLVHQSLDDHVFDLARSREIDERERARVVGHRRCDQQSTAARSTVGRAEPTERIFLCGITLLDGRAVKHPAAPRIVDLVEHAVAHRVTVGEDDTRVVWSPRRHERAVRARPESLSRPGTQVNADRRDGRLLARLDREVRDLRLVVDVDHVRSHRRTPPRRAARGTHRRSGSRVARSSRPRRSRSSRGSARGLGARGRARPTSSGFCSAICGGRSGSGTPPDASIAYRLRCPERFETNVMRPSASCGSTNRRADSSDSIRSARLPAVSAATIATGST